jgi:hypothetical protein
LLLVLVFHGQFDPHGITRNENLILKEFYTTLYYKLAWLYPKVCLLPQEEQESLARKNKIWKILARNQTILTARTSCMQDLARQVNNTEHSILSA